MQADLQCVWTGGSDPEHPDTQQATIARTPTQTGSAEQQLKQLKKQLKQLKQQLKQLKQLKKKA